MKKIIAFDLDDTIAPSKSPLPLKMSELLAQLLDKFIVCIISGGKFEQFEEQILNNLTIEVGKPQKLHIIPTCGTRYYLYDALSDQWERLYAEDFTPKQKNKILTALKEGSLACGYDQERAWGDQIEDRGSQITFSALGQKAPVEAKAAWDPMVEKRKKLRDYVAKKIPEFEVRTGGSTSVDITKLGVDKAYGINKLMKYTGVAKKDILFIGDRLQKDGNDYPVKIMGVDCIEVPDWHGTALVLETLLAVIN